MAQPVYIATLTLMDGTPVQIPILQIASYSEQFDVVENPTPPPTHIKQFKQTVIKLTNEKEIAVQEPATAAYGSPSVSYAITTATNVGPP